MELKTFIRETLVQIIDAVVEAGDYARAKGALVNPRMAEISTTLPQAQGFFWHAGHGWREESRDVPNC